MANQVVPQTYPFESPSRSVIDLSGIWHIAFDFDELGEDEFAKSDVIPTEAKCVAVPGSYNDQFTEKAIRDFIGQVWYYRRICIPRDTGQRYFLRFASANYSAKVYLAGKCIGGHDGGHLPFTLAIPDEFAGCDVLLAVMVDNNLSLETIPPGIRKDYTIEEHGFAMKKLEYQFDFFHYSGLNRRVHLVSAPKTFTADATIVTKEISDGKAILSYELDIAGVYDSISISLSCPGKDSVVVENANASGKITIDNPLLWRVGQGGLYDFTVKLHAGGEVIDEMAERIGIRTVAVEGDKFLVNGEEVYFKGFGRHEDFLITGRNIPDAVLIRDFELMKWIGANSFRTSHYPYSEETMLLADEMGFMVIDETPAVGLQRWGQWDAGWFDSDLANKHTLAQHCSCLTELIHRDKNRPCVVMWSVANEAATGDVKARSYFKTLVDLTRKLDPTRPVTNVLFTGVDKENTIDMFDVICLNRYVSWYFCSGDIEAVPKLLGEELQRYHDKYNMPILLSEFGADTIEGAHHLPARQFSEEYQSEFLAAYFDVFDSLSFIIGEHVWNFADFMTKQEPGRAVGNRKGLFTRDRQPKLAAHTTRQRWNKQ